jgi:hypothetical protein
MLGRIDVDESITSLVDTGKDAATGLSTSRAIHSSKDAK